MLVEKKNIQHSPINWKLDTRSKLDLEQSKDCLYFFEQESNEQQQQSLVDIVYFLYDNVINDFIKNKNKNQINNRDIFKTNIFNNDNKNSLKEYIKIEKYLILWCSLDNIKENAYCFYRLNNNNNNNENNNNNNKNNLEYLILIVGPTQIQQSKSSEEIAKSFSSAISYPSVQYQLHQARNKQEVIESFVTFLNNIENDNENQFERKLIPPIKNNNNYKEQNNESLKPLESVSNGLDHENYDNDDDDDDINDDTNINNKENSKLNFKYLINDIKYRYDFEIYKSDWKDGLKDWKSFQKTLSTTVFLFFAILLPSIAFGVLNYSNTEGLLGVSKTIIAQGIGGMIFALLSGQPMVILLSTAPLAIFIKITYSISIENGLDFYSLYSMIGLFNGFFLIIYSISGASRLMKYSSRFIEETFAIFITIAFLYDGIKPIVVLFIDNLYSCDNNCQLTNQTPVFTLLISLCTLWICFKLSNFNQTKYFNGVFRNLISDYALFLGVLISSAIRWTVFLPLEDEHFSHGLDDLLNTEIKMLPVWAYFLALALGFLLSLLYFVDQNISCSLATTPSHNLKKWSGVHLDLLIVAFINIVLSFLGLPWLHGALPHSSLHVRALATIESFTDTSTGETKEIFISVQETRASGFFSHLLIFICIFLVSNILIYIPIPVLYGVFFFLGVKATVGNQFWYRILLLITDNTFLPNSNMIRYCTKLEIHKFTTFQIICLLIFCFISFYPNPYLTIFFPLFLTILIPIKNYLLPIYFKKIIINILDN
ncbi:hypothetical protein DDB_G0270422 [Dictyostelium discoideum AX4]|uniref:Bicarbonate transporter-like transmembrane domain-containing protein n=1 Tax=Dictyostelium discoideum TaxID=44689 RepID=Q55BP1_DICDI|nr:hypothetical protein DDB_G0270422 [Dictyostelium discoideum AX4]EAL72561.1 hypothetical protein DDB_G0270422 [Dictyostelium discoideum AX4]|eukprot:XP_646790.1 hypothetical protein DDB_G0270422 [Dictyostelium discoideum AX4]